MTLDPADIAQEAAATTPGDTQRDKPPGSFGDKPKRKYVKKESSDIGGRSKGWIVKQLSAILTAPGFAFELVGEEWPKAHVDQAGPRLAQALADHAERNPAFKLRLVTLLEGGETAGLIVAAALYVVPLGAYFGVLPVPARARAMLGVPNRGEMAAGGAAGGGPGGPPSVEALEAEAREKGFADVGDYMNAVQQQINDLRGPGAGTPPGAPPE